MSAIFAAPTSHTTGAERSEYRPGPTLVDVLRGGGVLSRGDAGEGVRTLQALLNLLGASPPLAEDGLFGPKTQAALAGAQGGPGAGAGDTPGRCGPETFRALLGQALGPGIGGTNPPAGAIASLYASGPGIGGMNPPAGAIASLYASGPGIGGTNPPAGAPLDDFSRQREGSAARGPQLGVRPGPGQCSAGSLQLEDTLRRNRDRAAREGRPPRAIERPEPGEPRPPRAIERPEPPRPARPSGGPLASSPEPRELSSMVDWAKDRVGQPYVFGKNDCGTMVRDYIKHFGLTPGPGSDNHMMLPKPLDFYGAFEAKDGQLQPLRDRGGLLGKNHEEVAPGMIFGIGELCPMSDCRALGHAPDGTSFDTLYSCSHSGIITNVVREGGRVTDFGFAEMHGSVKGGGPGMTFHDSFAAWAASKSRSDFKHAFVYAPPGGGAAEEPSPGALSPERRKQIDAVWAREAGGTFKGLVEWDPTEAFPSLGPFHTTWDNPAAGEAGRAGGNSFSSFLRFAAARGAEVPREALDDRGEILERSPWTSRSEMERDPGRVNGLRRWLNDPQVQDLQLAFAEDRLSRLAQNLGPQAEQAYAEIAARGATDLLVDLVNFKGEGAVRGTLARFRGEGDVRRAVADAAWQTLQATRSSRDLGQYGAGWKNRLEGYWKES